MALYMIARFSWYRAMLKCGLHFMDCPIDGLFPMRTGNVINDAGAGSHQDHALKQPHWLPAGVSQDSTFQPYHHTLLRNNILQSPLVCLLLLLWCFAFACFAALFCTSCCLFITQQQSMWRPPLGVVLLGLRVIVAVQMACPLPNCKADSQNYCLFWPTDGASNFAENQLSLGSFCCTSCTLWTTFSVHWLLLCLAN